MFFHQFQQSKVFFEFPSLFAYAFLQAVNITLPYRFDHIILLIFTHYTIPNFRPAQVFLLAKVDNELVDLLGPFLGLPDQSLISPDAVSFCSILNGLNNLFPCFSPFSKIYQFFILFLGPHFSSFRVIYFSELFLKQFFKRFILINSLHLSVNNFRSILYRKGFCGEKLLLCKPHVRGNGELHTIVVNVWEVNHKIFMETNEAYLFKLRQEPAKTFLFVLRKTIRSYLSEKNDSFDRNRLCFGTQDSNL